MVGAPGDLPDWTNAILLQGVDGDGNPVAVLLDATGQLYALLRGEDALGDPQTVRVDSDGQLYTVLKGASGHSVSVDSDGFITAVLKGQVAGTLTTIAVDTDGRIEAFILDSENQWGDVIRTGNSELAARLGSPVAWDWRGHVLACVDFRNGWPASQLSTSGTGAAAVMSPEMWLNGGFSAKLTGGSDGAGYAACSLRAGPNPTGRIGLSVCFACSDTPDYLMLTITYQRDNAGYRARARIDFDNGQLQVIDDEGEYQNVQAVSPYANPSYWHSFKFVVDIGTGFYERVLFDDVEVDVSSYECLELGAGSDVLTAAVYLYSHSGSNDYAYIDSLVLTTSEPANS